MSASGTLECATPWVIRPRASLPKPSFQENDSMSKADLTAERLRELLHYDPETGVFTWKTKPGRRIRLGAQAGSAAQGYLEIGVCGGRYRAHRLAWLYVYGVWPKHDIDHIDGNRANNAIANLRDVTRAVNIQNMRRPKPGNKSGYLGVAPCSSRWSAQVHVAGKKRHLGVFDTPELAHAAYVEAKRRLHEGCTL